MAALLFGGCDFAVDPDLEAPDAPVFWNPVDAPAVVHLIAPVLPVGVPSVTLTRRGIDERTDETGVHWRRLRNGAVLTGPSEISEAALIGVLIPFDHDWPIRIAAAERLRTTLIDRTADPPLTKQSRERLKRALRCVDGRADGASYRTVATVFFGARRVADEDWKTSSLKAQIARLNRHGCMLIDHGYRRLLKARLH